ncbi:hypothetical protein FACS1894202_06750 [Clostridia bacterium]|nr:hypothetical protein FACS1894202_06750 [Clostridia bacterium]
MKRMITTALSMFMAVVMCVSALAAEAKPLDGAASDTAAYILKNVKVPGVGSVGGEWAVIGLARSGYRVPGVYYSTYYKNVETYLKERKGVLHERKHTEYSRVIIALTAIGRDPRSVAGYDLTAALGDFDKTIAQGVNGAVWALIALDSGGYGTRAIREKYVAEILKRQLTDGGWSLTGKTSTPDLTGMALQALSKYQDKAAVKAATDRALTYLSALKDTDAESAAQILIAMCELGVSDNDKLVDKLLGFKTADGGFSHTAGGGAGLMPTEQALCAIVAARRVRDGKTSLYRISSRRIYYSSNAGLKE